MPIAFGASINNPSHIVIFIAFLHANVANNSGSSNGSGHASSMNPQMRPNLMLDDDLVDIDGLIACTTSSNVGSQLVHVLMNVVTTVANKKHVHLVLLIIQLEHKIEMAKTVNKATLARSLLHIPSVIAFFDKEGGNFLGIHYGQKKEKVAKL